MVEAQHVKFHVICLSTIATMGLSVSVRKKQMLDHFSLDRVQKREGSEDMAGWD